MKRIKVLGLTLVAIFAIGVMTAASASATLPVIQEAGTAEGSLTSADTLETPASALTGTKVTIKLTNGAKTALGTYEAVFQGVKEKTLACKSSTGKTEEVINTGEFHLVWLNKGQTEIGVLFLPTAFTIECGGKTKIKIKGAAIGKTSLALKTSVSSFTGTLEGKAGKQNLTEYFNNSGTATKGILEANFGLGYEIADENVTGPVTLTVAGGKKIEVKNE